MISGLIAAVHDAALIPFSGLSGDGCRERFRDILRCFNSEDTGGDLGSNLTGFAFLLDEAISNDFFKAPASTRFHGSFESGLAMHSLGVLHKAITLAEHFGFEGKIDKYTLKWFFGLVIASLFHDYCKAGLYTVDFRNVKNDQGVWHKEPFYKVRDGSTGVGHGTESLRRISKFITLPYEWELAVAHHMGSFGLTNEENLLYLNCCKAYPEVLLLHTADMLQVSLGGA